MPSDGRTTARCP